MSERIYGIAGGPCEGRRGQGARARASAACDCCPSSLRHLTRLLQQRSPALLLELSTLFAN